MKIKKSKETDMKIKYLLILSVAILASGCAHTEKAEEEVAEIEAAQMEGRSAARIFVSRPWRDTTELHSLLLEARARRARYDTIGKTRCAEAYDSAFVSTIRTVRPDVARVLE